MAWFSYGVEWIDGGCGGGSGRGEQKVQQLPVLNILLIFHLSSTQLLPCRAWTKEL